VFLALGGFGGAGRAWDTPLAGRVAVSSHSQGARSSGSLALVFAMSSEQRESGRRRSVDLKLGLKAVFLGNTKSCRLSSGYPIPRTSPVGQASQARRAGTSAPAATTSVRPTRSRPSRSSQARHASPPELRPLVAIRQMVALGRRPSAEHRTYRRAAGRASQSSPLRARADRQPRGCWPGMSWSGCTATTRRRYNAGSGGTDPMARLPWHTCRNGAMSGRRATGGGG
jgi:hypothetical protein